MLNSQEFARIYGEISELMKSKQYASAYVAVGELRRFAMTRGQIVKVVAIELFLEQKLALKPGVKQ